MQLQKISKLSIILKSQRQLNRQRYSKKAKSVPSISKDTEGGNLQNCLSTQPKKENQRPNSDINQMNLIQSIQRKYLPGFYQARYNQRKRIALSLKQKCLKNPKQLSIFQLKVILKVLQQFDLLQKQPILEEKEKQLKVKIAQNSIWSTVGALLPYGLRQFHRLKFVRKAVTGAVIFCGINYLLMSSYFKDYISQCQKVAQRHIAKLIQDSKLPQT